MAAAGYPYFFAVILNDRHAIVLGRLSYAAAVLVLAACALARHGRRQRVVPDELTPDEVTPDKVTPEQPDPFSVSSSVA